MNVLQVNIWMMMAEHEIVNIGYIVNSKYNFLVHGIKKISRNCSFFRL